jgi:cyclopropane-fatty-acyl-phospholipid synthase
VGLTLSEEQQRWAKNLLNPFGQQRFDVRLQDYRDENRRYDAIISIEMFEAVGERYWEAYFSTLTRCLKSDGVAVIQTITIDERLFDRYRRSTDFIQQYIFPGGMLPSPTIFEQQARQQGLRIEKAFAFGQDYGRTLAEWAKRFESQRARIGALGFDERFIRMWRFYLAYCEAGFSQGDINVMQYTLRHA